MSWSKPIIIDILKAPKALHRGRWLCFFIILFLITSIVLALMWPDNNSFLQWQFWLSIVFISTVIESIAISVRLYFYGLAQEEYEIWQHEQKNIEQNWQDWAMQSLVVLDSFYVLPNKLNLDDLLTNNPNVSSKINKSLAFDEKFDLNEHIECLFISMRDMLSQLPVKEPINIIVYSSPESYGLIGNNINDAYKNAKIAQPYTVSFHIMNHVDIDKLMELIDSPQSALQLIIIDNTSSLGSAFLCGFLLTDKTSYQDLTIDVAKSEILRPMITSDMSLGIQQMVEIQHAIHHAKQLWFSNLDNKQQVDVTKQLAQWDISPEQMHQLESIVGNQTELSFWLSLALTCEMVTQKKQNNLIATMTQNQWLFSVVAK
ncbi:MULTISPECIES: hypothetical protein [unclassified Gilliamella]|uniref:hypothetical protein n=1 Tax=unclassified Gilliamella TaxID=2685620 RepID=UPI00080EDBFF|nr:hypothetical protein [Gilliamella apicola]OCG21366.1 hypothetical protein A9G23_04905 [Gilliamella apicola]OCG23602.1 hypothetical protein A9G22_06040 [Gilliamella apicola]